MCTRSALLRLLWALSFLWLFTIPGKTVVRTCPQCSHLLGRHARRADGSFRD